MNRPSNLFRTVVWRNPEPLQPPVINRNLSQLPAILRVAEVVWFTVLKIEYWLSPHGNLREWVRFNVGVMLILGIPTLLLTPVITLLIVTVVSWTTAIALIAESLVSTAQAVAITLLWIAGITFILRVFSRR